MKAEVQVRRQSALEVPKQSTLNHSRDKRLPTSQRLCLVNKLRIAPMAGFAILFLCLAYLLRTEDALGPVIYLQRYINWRTIAAAFYDSEHRKMALPRRIYVDRLRCPPLVVRFTAMLRKHFPPSKPQFSAYSCYLEFMYF